MKLAYRNYLYEATDIPNVVINGLEKPSMNSLGEYIAGSKEAIENFWKWFGDSKAVDEQGRPIVFFHGSYGDFEEFQHPWERDEDDEYTEEGYVGGNLGIGFYFTKNKEYASRFGKIDRYYLRILNLYDLTDGSNVEELNARFREERDELAYGEAGEVIDEIMEEEKYDGVYAMDAGGLSYGADEWKIVRGSQAKLVSNSGAFSNSNKIAGE